MSYTFVPYLQLFTSRLRTATMQVSKDTPDELAALTKPLEPVVKRVPKKQLKEKVSGRMQWPVEDLGPAQTL